MKNLHVCRASAGSGKTYTLAAHYVALLLHGESYRSILAVTFTNKATAEMKERILNYLFAIAREPQHPDTQNFLKRVREIYAELGYNKPYLTDDYCVRRSEELFNQILADYDSMRVSTIDTFLQTLLSGMVQMLGGSVGYGVELDNKQVITNAVDNLLTEGAQQPVVRKLLAEYMGQRMDKEKGWDIRSSLIHIAQELYSEAIQKRQDMLVTDAPSLDAFAQALDWKTLAPVSKLEEALKKTERFVAADFNYGAMDFIGRFDKYRKSLVGEIEKVEEYFADFSMRPLKGLLDAGTWLKVYKGSENPEKVRKELNDLRDLAAQCRTAYLHYDFCTRHLNDLKLMGYLKQQIDQMLSEHNTRLLSETASTLARALQPGDADFVLEKAGTRYRHIMLDEFQDTSTLQWENFCKLVQELLSSEPGSTLIVGDIKQSIYRWRNGDWTIMANLEKNWEPFYNDQIEPLVRNHRSERHVVEFNLDTFSRLSAQEAPEVFDIYDEGYIGANISDYYRAGHEHGYVQLSLNPSMFDDIERLLQKGVLPKDMLILIRNKKEASLVIDGLQAAKNDGNHPCLAQLSLISGDSFHLEYSQSVNTLMCALRYIYRHDDVACEYLRQVCPSQQPEQFRAAAHPGLSLLDVAELAVRSYLCPDGSFVAQDLAYVNSFMDKLHGYIAKHGSDGEAFVQYWDDTLAEKSIPAGATDGIRMMTIHSSKGLEAKNVFIPYCSWEMESDYREAKLWCPVTNPVNFEQILLPIPQNKTTPEAGFAKEYNLEHQMMRIDNLNLLYVALTRAAERLYIYLDTEKQQENVGQLLMTQYGLSDDMPTLTRGEEFWDKNIDDKDKKRSNLNPFSFSDAQELMASYHSSESHIIFEQSQDSRRYGWDIASRPLDSSGDLDQRAFGTICHDILASLGIYPNQTALEQTASQTVKDFYQRGIIPTEEVYKKTLESILRTVQDSQLTDFFLGDWETLREEAVLYKNEAGKVEEKRMDRVMRRGDTAIVLDYKFGQDNPHYDLQVRTYMDICRRMGYTNVQGYLYLASTQTLQQVL